MALTSTPAFPQGPSTTVVLVTTAVTSRAKKSTPFTNFVDLTPVSTNGKLCEAITVKAAGTTAAGQVFIWLWDGVDAYLIKEIPVDAVTPTTTVKSFESTTIFDTSSNPPIRIPPTYKLMATTTITQDINVSAACRDY